MTGRNVQPTLPAGPIHSCSFTDAIKWLLLTYQVVNACMLKNTFSCLEEEQLQASMSQSSKNMTLVYVRYFVSQ